MKFIVKLLNGILTTMLYLLLNVIVTAVFLSVLALGIAIVSPIAIVAFSIALGSTNFESLPARILSSILFAPAVALGAFLLVGGITVITAITIPIGFALAIVYGFKQGYHFGIRNSVSNFITSIFNAVQGIRDNFAHRNAQPSNTELANQIQALPAPPTPPFIFLSQEVLDQLDEIKDDKTVANLTSYKDIIKAEDVCMLSCTPLDEIDNPITIGYQLNGIWHDRFHDGEYLIESIRQAHGQAKVPSSRLEIGEVTRTADGRSLTSETIKIYRGLSPRLQGILQNQLTPLITSLNESLSAETARRQANSEIIPTVHAMARDVVKALTPDVDVVIRRLRLLKFGLFVRPTPTQEADVDIEAQLLARSVGSAASR